jgi:hypothetical protein
MDDGWQKPAWKVHERRTRWVSAEKPAALQCWTVMGVGD